LNAPVPPQLEEHFRVRSYEVDPDGQLRIVVLARMLQEAAAHHAQLLGKDFEERESGALFWVISRLRFRIDRYPRRGDEFKIRTWPVGTMRLLAIREFAMLDESGVMGQVSSAWLAVDGSSGRPVRPETIVGDWHVTPSEFESDLSRLSPLGEMEAGDPRTVQYHDIDQNRHVNNTAYLEWMIDAVAARRRTLRGGFGDSTMSAIEIGPIHELSIDFMKELTVGEEYCCRVADGDGVTECDIIRAADAEPICRARMTWKEEQECRI